MAINSLESGYDDSPTKSVDSSSWRLNSVSKKSSPCVNGSLKSGSSYRSKQQSKSLMISPYLNGDKVKLHSRVTEKKMVHKKTTDFVSSFPLAASIYKANSDEFKIPKRKHKKVKKSVLTLPNDLTLPQACTVSDMNDSEYNETKNIRKPKPKKKRNIKKFPVDKNIEIYDRDARYCSQLNINLDSSSTDMFKHLTGDGSRVIKKSKTNTYGRNQVVDNDVWAVLRNINKIQFIPSPPMSLNSIVPLKNKNKSKRRSNDRKDTRFIETCRTEEFAYISYDSNSINSCSRSTSYDRITVIGRQDEVKETCTKIQDENSEVTKKGVITNQKSQRPSRISSNNNKTHALNDKQDNNVKVKTLDDDKHHGKCSAKNISNNNDDNVLNVGCEDNKSMALATISINTDSYGDTNTKSNFLKTISLKTVPEKSSLTSMKGRQDQLNGITRVVVSKGKDIDKGKQQTVIRKPRLVTTMPSSSGVPKLSQADIKRRLANMKFPIVVTGKDQMSSCIKVPYSEPLQFSGLDNQIWPFMSKWLPKINIQNESINKRSSTNGNTAKRNFYKSPERNVSDDRLPMTMMNNGDRNCIKQNNCVEEISIKPRLVKDGSSDLDPHASNKVRPMHQYKDKMLNIICNKPFYHDTVQRSMDNNAKDTKLSEFNKSIKYFENQINAQKLIKQKNKSVSIPSESAVNRLKSGNMWAKAKRASDFIENVIRKIKCGIYYDEEYHSFTKKVDAEDRYTQTDCVGLTNIEEGKAKRDTTDVIDETFDTKNIPGFEDTWQDLELESITKNQIAVKHCITNIVVHFDIAFPYDNTCTLQQKQSLSCIPIEITSSQTKIYKYKTSITNAMLPAEICTILPKMLTNIFDTNPKVAFPNIVEKIEYSLPTITEVQHRGNCERSLNIFSPYNLLPRAVDLRNGKFSSNILVREKVDIEQDNFTSYKYSSFYNLLPKINTYFWWGNYIYIPRVDFKFIDKIITKREDSCDANKCMALLPYVPPKFNFGGENTLKNLETKLTHVENPRIYFDRAIFVNFTLQQFGNPSVIELRNNPLEEDSFVTKKKEKDIIHDNLQNNNLDNNNALVPYKASFPSSNVHKLDRYKDEIKDFQQLLIPHKVQSKMMFDNVKRKRSYIRLNKKCKSTSSISNYKKSTSLQKIANLDEFFQALGLSKDMGSVIDGNVERKVLSSIIEMKAWTSDITSRQALLVLLLANKKETSNLIRFRTVLLQGIAMNRITKASELDMEIEVIERESLSKLPQCEGISYLPASIENQDNLLEELCWIAKTTASDYQRPFDKSSERLLKSLLCKRKKLNPSYLRVMARYVGLGLLNAK
ncbi:uncharacterized protein LOC123698616 isoform X1 [Colias croceus]|uniref:uncharacterized protein LOC123698616 isoform X1 n=1 Tax=Colias crocea TaxID=72248 RepID=UPI001E27D003|nr:uncharacterized protein LOC123698616 isoform X1 [Colias croceus]XP_045501293.1 uncharacterized protein LOC123698616 isoform X1 [Colias croceus]